MSGVAGYIDFNQNTTVSILKQMIDAIHHRGPDSHLYEDFNSSGVNIGLGQTTLSLNNTAPNGSEPERYKHLSIVMDGEIYNTDEIKQLLKFSDNHVNSLSDAELLLYAFDEWGVEFTEKLNGIFAMVILDHKQEKLYIFRDRVGIRPVYYYWRDGLFLFASELKSLFVHPGFMRKIDVNVLRLFLCYGYIPSPYSIIDYTYKIEPGKVLIFDFNSRKVQIDSYWKIEDFYHKAKIDISFDEAKDKVHELLVSSCHYRMKGSIPVGITLSGGYDSTSIAAIVQKNWSEQVNTFTIGFEEGGNEAPYAKETAKYLGTNHTEYICTAKEAQDLIPELAYYYDEPFADDSAIPTMLVSRLIKKQFNVALFADGGDHVFAGRADILYRNQSIINRVPDAMKGSLRMLLLLSSNLSPIAWPQLKHKSKSIAGSLNQNHLAQAGSLLRESYSYPDFYLKRFFQETTKALPTPFDNSTAGFQNEIDIVTAFEFKMNLPDCILAKVEHGNMSASLHGREPMLDHRIVEYVAQLPTAYSFDGTTKKRILRNIIYDYVPKSLMDRPKFGFTPPIHNWLRGELSYLFDDYLNDKALSDSEVLNNVFISRMLDKYKKGKLYYSNIVWRILMFQMWHARWMK